MAIRRKKVVVAMSGGVDSSVAAALLLREGYEVIGVFMRLGSPGGVQAAEEMQSDELTEPCRIDSSTVGLIRQANRTRQGCCSVLDADDARRVAGMLGIPFYVLNFEQEFGRIIDYFVDEYNRGRTPNPCVRCNDWLKFGRLAQYAEAVGADYVASGHYARVGVDPGTGEQALMRGRDHRKDQSYVLFGMSPQVMRHTLLPIGGYEKHEVRRMAEQMKLPVFNKPDSQEICFVPNQDYAGLVRRRSPGNFREGELVTAGGEVVGRHDGHQHFTVGQRRGVGVAFGYPIYVVDIDPQSNRVTLGERERLLKSHLTARQINILSGRARGAAGLPCQVKIRYNHAPQPARLTITGGDELRVDFEIAQPAVTPGQAVVVYDGDVVLAGGWIESAG